MGGDRETPLLTVPLFHATGLLGGFLISLQLDQKVVMMHKWDALDALQLIQDEKVTALSTVLPVIQDLLRHPAFDAYDTSPLIRVAAAGAATPAGLPELIASKVGSPSQSAGYGMTETMAVGATMSGAIFDLKPESVGIVSPIVEIRFVDANGEELPTGEPGEIEQLVYEMGHVQENVVFGVPDETMGEELALIYFCTPGTTVEEHEVRGFLQGRLVNYKVPKHIQINSTALPQNASGKLHKQKVKEQFLKAQARRG